MTATPKALQGTELLDTIKANPEMEKEELIALCGYTDKTPFYEAILDAKQVDIEAALRMKEANELLGIDTKEFKANHNQKAIERHISVLGVIGYRYLVYQRLLDEGLEDEKLAEQQKEFAGQIIGAARILRGVLGEEAGMTGADIIGVMTRLFGYAVSGHFETAEEKAAATPEKVNEHCLQLTAWAMNTPAMRKAREVFNLGFTPDEITTYDYQQIRRQDVVATYLRSKTLDFVSGSKNAEDENYLTGLREANVFMSLMDSNSGWTSYGIGFLLSAVANYQYRALETGKTKLEVIKFAFDAVDQMIDAGNAVRSEQAS